MVETTKNGALAPVNIPNKDKVIAASTTADRNEIALGRILKWLVAKDYL
ncbi:MAG: hypothetical protein ACXVJN_12850 [Mucilaginibacter sp.]